MDSFSFITSLIVHLLLFLVTAVLSYFAPQTLNPLLAHQMGQNFIEVSLSSSLEDAPVSPPPAVQDSNKIFPQEQILTKQEELKPVVQPIEKKKILSKIKPLEKKTTVENEVKQVRTSDVKQDLVQGSLASAVLGQEQARRESHAKYRDVFFTKILAEKRYPEKARKRKIEGEGFLEIHLDQEGKVTSLNLLKSTGSDLLDQEILSLIQRSAPFPKLPSYLQEFSARLPIQFSLSK